MTISAIERHSLTEMFQDSFSNVYFQSRNSLIIKFYDIKLVLPPEVQKRLCKLLIFKHFTKSCCCSPSTNVL